LIAPQPGVELVIFQSRVQMWESVFRVPIGLPVSVNQNWRGLSGPISNESRDVMTLRESV